MKHIIMVSVSVACLSSYAQQITPASPVLAPRPAEVVAAQPVAGLSPVDPDKILTAEAKRHAHVCFVNVDNAVNDVRFRDAVAAVTLCCPIHLAVADVKNMTSDQLLLKKPKNSAFGDKAKIVVYVVKKPEMVMFAGMPLRWAMVNMAGLDKNLPQDDPDAYRARLRKMILKGLALACGVGANMDSGRCVMSMGSFTESTIDQTSASFSPFAGIVLMDTLLKVGGSDIFLSGDTEEEK
jgi:hypothetical protein